MSLKDIVHFIFLFNNIMLYFVDIWQSWFLLCFILLDPSLSYHVLSYPDFSSTILS